MSRNLFWLSDEQWRRIEPHLPTDVRGVERQDDRRVISGIIHVLPILSSFRRMVPHVASAKRVVARAMRRSALIRT